MHTSSEIVDLRKLLTERFPNLRLRVEERKRNEPLPTGLPALDALLGGGLPRGEFTEMIAGSMGSGSVEVIHEFLRHRAMDGQFLALVDGLGSFDASVVEPAILKRLLWIRCHNTTEAFQATDLLLRDRNFPFLIMDLKLNPTRELRRINPSTWYRYGRLVEQNQTTVLVVTPYQLVSGAACRVAVESGFGIRTVGQSRSALILGLRFRVLRSGAEPSYGLAG